MPSLYITKILNLSKVVQKLICETIGILEYCDKIIVMMIKISESHLSNSITDQWSVEKMID